MILMKEWLLEYYESIGEKIRVLSGDEKERIWDGVRKKYIIPKKREISYENIVFQYTNPWLQKLVQMIQMRVTGL